MNDIIPSNRHLKSRAPNAQNKRTQPPAARRVATMEELLKPSKQPLRVNARGLLCF